jgi:hypothetical protein
MKKWIAALLCLCLLWTSLPYATSAAEASSVRVPDMTFSGIRLSPDDFRFAFVGEEADLLPLSQCTSRSVVLAEITQMTITDRAISFALSVTLEDGSELLQYFSGELCWGANRQTGQNSITVRFNKHGSPPVLSPVLFNIYNDTDENDLLTEPGLTGQPHLRFYVTDRQGQLYLFETALNNALLVQGDPTWDEYGSDVSWFWPYVGAQTTEEPLTDEMKQLMGLPVTSARALNDYTGWTPETMYRKETVIGGEPVVCLSAPCVRYMHTDVLPYFGEWHVMFWVAEVTSKDGAAFYGVTPFEYRNLQIGVSFVSQTYLSSLCREGQFLQDRIIGNDFAHIASAVLSIAEVSNEPSVRTISAILALLELVVAEAKYWLTTKTAAINPASQVTAGTATTEMFEGLYYAAHSEILDDCYFFNTHTNRNGVNKSGHYYHLHLNPRYRDASNKTYATMGKLSISFDMIDTSCIVDPDDTPTHIDLGTIDLPYTARPS